jgi:broad specificity phosphatase PhoE
VAVVSHEAVNRLVLADLDSAHRAAESLRQVPGCFNVLEQRGGTWKVLNIGSVPEHHVGPSELLRPKRSSPPFFMPRARRLRSG